MFGFLKGQVLDKYNDQIILLVQSVGYEVFLSAKIIQNIQIEQELSLYIYTALREDGIYLYGFLNKEDKILFTKLLNVSGIGPKSALSLLSHLHSQELIQTIVQGDLIKLTSVPGVGKKTAERLVLELKDPLKNLVLAGENYYSLSRSESDHDLFSALTNLGYPPYELEKKLKGVDFSEFQQFELKLKEALRILSKNK